jgi:hypothetical protein
MVCAPLTVQGYGRCDRSLHPQGQAALVSCWNGWLYLVRHDGTVQATIEVGGPARLRWGAFGRFVVAGTQQGEIGRVEADGTTAWHTRLPVRPAFAKILPPPVNEQLG